MTTAFPLAATELPSDAIEVGRIGDAWGVKGWFKVLPHSAQPQALFAARRWYLQPSEKGARTFSGTAMLDIRQVREHSDSVVAHAQNVADRNAAELLRGARIFLSRTDFPAAQDGEYYWVDLIGLEVINREGVSLGEVRDLLSTGPQTVLVLQQEQGNKPIERMIPFVAAFVDQVDLAGRRITVDWQPDY